ncbi:MAG: hypothetical protein NVS9B14_21120 [Candidatus Acidiferrum sp.]
MVVFLVVVVMVLAVIVMVFVVIVVFLLKTAAVVIVIAVSFAIPTLVALNGDYDYRGRGSRVAGNSRSGVGDGVGAVGLLGRIYYESIVLLCLKRYSG